MRLAVEWAVGGFFMASMFVGCQYGTCLLVETIQHPTTGSYRWSEGLECTTDQLVEHYNSVTSWVD